MKKMLLTTACVALMSCCCSDLQAAELLDVKPILTGSSVSIEITADVPMTYTYYKVPGQARTVVDIAEADPEKIEPLIVVNKGIVSSISVDKAQIAGMVVSRLVFNLIDESDFAVTASADRKHLTVTFGKAAAAGTPVVKSETAAITSEPVKDNTATTPAAEMTVPARIPAIKPIIAGDVPPATVSIRSIVTGNNYLDIMTDRAISDYKVITLKKPERLVLDLPGAKSTLSTKSISINKFGISTLRIGFYPAYVRVVLDTVESIFPKYSIATTRDGIRITFK
jgi:hypothetical protein